MLVYGGNFQLASSAWLDMLSYLYHAVRVEVETYHCVVTLRLCWLLFDAQAVAVLVEFCHAITLRVVYVVTEYAGVAFLCSFHALLEQTGEACSVEDVVAQYKAYIVIANELFSDNECLCQSVW